MSWKQFLIAASLASMVGCTSSGPNAVAQDPIKQAATQPSNVTVTAADFDKLWAATDRTSRDLLFTPSREDRRTGLYRTDPMISAQWFEPWRREVRTADSRLESSMASIRRTLSVQVNKSASGEFVATPSVLVERLALAERRVSTAAGYRGVFGDRRAGSYGSIETDAGLELPDTYWYSIGNDPALERYVAKEIEEHVRK